MKSQLWIRSGYQSLQGFRVARSQHLRKVRRTSVCTLFQRLMLIAVVLLPTHASVHEAQIEQNPKERPTRPAKGPNTNRSSVIQIPLDELSKRYAELKHV